MSNYCGHDRLCVLPGQQMIKTGIDQPKLYVNVNKKLSNLYGHQKKTQHFNQVYNELLNELKIIQMQNCVKSVVSDWFTHKTPRCNNFSKITTTSQQSCSNYKNKTFSGTDKVVCYSEPAVSTSTNVLMFIILLLMFKRIDGLSTF